MNCQRPFRGPGGKCYVFTTHALERFDERFPFSQWAASECLLCGNCWEFDGDVFVIDRFTGAIFVCAIKQGLWVVVTTICLWQILERNGLSKRRRDNFWEKEFCRQLKAEGLKRSKG